MNNGSHILQAEQALDKVLDIELKSIVESATAPAGSEKSLLIRIPDGHEIDHSPDELASLVARTANNYQKACRDAGIANAVLKRAEGRYKRKFKLALGVHARNAQEREAQAMEAAEAEFAELNIVESVVELADYQEQACRVASESARKLLDKVTSIRIGSAREERGAYLDRDYR